MGNLWKVSVAEYTRLARKRSFVLSLIAVPLFIGVIIAIAVITNLPKGDSRPVGYVDLAGVMQSPVVADYTPDPAVAPPQPFADDATARKALESGAIQGYYVIPADYLKSRSVTLYTWDKSPSGEARAAFDRLLTAHLVGQAPAESRKVLLEGISTNFRAANEGREMAEESFIVSALLPFVIGFFFIMVVMSSGGYLLQAVTTEKENRMVEIMMTSVSPLQLIGGKAVGLVGVALTQIGVWLVALAVALVWGSTQVSWLRDFQISASTVAIAAVYFLPTYVLLAGLMITVGSMVTELQQGQQIAGAFNLLFAAPFFFLILVFTNPDSPILVFLTLFPTTSMMTLSMRWGFTAVPAWQLIASFVLLIAAALGSVWLAARVFRLGMLRYGQPLSIVSVIQLLRPSRPAVAGEAGRAPSRRVS